jgi:hypothetical protein
MKITFTDRQFRRKPEHCHVGNTQIVLAEQFTKAMTTYLADRPTRETLVQKTVLAGFAPLFQSVTGRRTFLVR